MCLELDAPFVESVGIPEGPGVVVFSVVVVVVVGPVVVFDVVAAGCEIAIADLHLIS